MAHVSYGLKLGWGERIGEYIALKECTRTLVQSS